MRKYFFISIAAFTISIIFISLSYAQVVIPFPSAPEYVLKTWQIEDGDSREYLWSIEGEPNQGYRGTLYKSLASPALRARISHFPPGTKLTWNFVGAGVPNGLPPEDFDEFRKFCLKRNIKFVQQVELF